MFFLKYLLTEDFVCTYSSLPNSIQWTWIHDVVKLCVYFLAIVENSKTSEESVNCFFLFIIKMADEELSIDWVCLSVSQSVFQSVTLVYWFVNSRLIRHNLSSLSLFHIFQDNPPSFPEADRADLETRPVLSKKYLTTFRAELLWPFPHGFWLLIIFLIGSTLEYIGIQFSDRYVNHVTNKWSIVWEICLTRKHMNTTRG